MLHSACCVYGIFNVFKAGTESSNQIQNSQVSFNHIQSFFMAYTKISCLVHITT